MEGIKAGRTACLAKSRGFPERRKQTGYEASDINCASDFKICEKLNPKPRRKKNLYVLTSEPFAENAPHITF